MGCVDSQNDTPPVSNQRPTARTQRSSNKKRNRIITKYPPE